MTVSKTMSGHVLSAQFRRRADGTLEPVPACAEVVIAADEAMVSISCGGGGYGHPHEREPSRVLADVREGWISRERAETICGVALDPEGAIDLDATGRLRNRG